MDSNDIQSLMDGAAADATIAAKVEDRDGRANALARLIGRQEETRESRLLEDIRDRLDLIVAILQEMQQSGA